MCGGNIYQKHKSKNPLVKLLMWNFHRTLIKLLKRTPIKKILDVGCGEGHTTVILLKNLKPKKIIGIDIDPKIIDYANKLYRNYGIKFYVGNVYNLNFANDSFDVVVATEILEHLESPDKAIREMKRVAKKYCLITVPKEPWWRIANIIRFAYLKDLGNTPGHIQHWTTNSFKKMLNKYFKKFIIKSAILWNVALCEV